MGPRGPTPGRVPRRRCTPPRASAAPSGAHASLFCFLLFCCSAQNHLHRAVLLSLFCGRSLFCGLCGGVLVSTYSPTHTPCASAAPSGAECRAVTSQPSSSRAQSFAIHTASLCVLSEHHKCPRSNRANMAYGPRIRSLFELTHLGKCFRGTIKK